VIQFITLPPPLFEIPVVSKGDLVMSTDKDLSADTLYETLCKIPDHRTAKGKRFPLPAVIAISLAAILSGANTMAAISRWGRRLSPKALCALGVPEKHRKAPCRASYHYIFRDISLPHLGVAFGYLVEEVDGKEPVHIAVDGKRLRGSRRGEEPGVHILNAFATRLQAVVGTMVVPPDSGEVIEVLELLKNLPLEGAVVTGDAAFSFETVVDAILEGGGDYFLFVKSNQPKLEAEIAHAFGDGSPQKITWNPDAPTEKTDPPDLVRAETLEKSHGRIERRMIAVRTGLPSRLDEKWHGITAICRIERRRETRTYCSCEVTYAICSLPTETLVPDYLLQLSRDHWGVENKLHHVLDVTFREDECRVTTGSAPAALSELRKAALTMIRKTGQKPRPARETYAERKWNAINLVMDT
jgi:predicted transposase YbfD/YdcC